MHKVNFLIIIACFSVLLTGCQKNKTTDENKEMAGDTTSSRTIQSSTEFKVTLNDNGLTPDTLRLTSGVCYQIEFENSGKSEAEFTAGKNPSSSGFGKNFFEGISVENIINDKEKEYKTGETTKGLKLKPGEKGSLAFTPTEDKKGEWQMAAKIGDKTGSQNGVIIVE